MQTPKRNIPFCSLGSEILDEKLDSQLAKGGEETRGQMHGLRILFNA
jgi:hypothetical protein